MESFDGKAFQTLHDTMLLPFTRQNMQFFNGELISQAEFLRVACMVQSRTFHMREDNWVTQTVSRVCLIPFLI